MCYDLYRSAPFADIAFLAASEPRLTVLRTLAGTAASQSRQDLAGARELPPAHVDRILGELEAREWIVETDPGYRITPSGTVVVEKFTTTLATLETERRLREVIEWVPTDAVGFDVRGLRDAEIILATESDPSTVRRRLAEWAVAAEQVRLLSGSIAVSLLDVMWHAPMHDEQRFEAVITSSVVETLQNDAAMAPLVVEMLDTANARVFVTDDIPVTVVIVDGTTILVLTDATDTLQAVIRSADAAVCEWATTTFEACRAASTPIEPDAFTP